MAGLDSSPNPAGLLALRTTNVSNPSIVHRKSEQSITASEDYYSLSSSSSSSRRRNDPSSSQPGITRFITPPSRYRTPAQSRDNLAAQPSTYDRSYAGEGTSALRGTGQRRQSADAGAARERVPMPMPLHFRQTSVKRKPVPSTVIERPESGSSPIQPIQQRGTVVDERSHFDSPPTPGPHDQNYLRFALDQLTRDEDVRGSRAYGGPVEGPGENDPFITQPTGPYHAQYTPTQGHEIYGNPFDDDRKSSMPRRSSQFDAREGDSLLGEEPEIMEARHAIPISPPPKDPRRMSTPPSNHSPQQSSNHPPLPTQPATPNVFLPLAADSSRPLNFLPGTLRLPHLAIFALVVLLYTICLIFAAGWSLTHSGLWAYATFGDGRYFLFRHLPTLLGTILLLWLFHIQTALTRISPFLAMASPSPETRSAGSTLPLYQTSFLLPSLHHFRARQPLIGFFALAAWLQLFTLPLLASSFNVYFFGSPDTGSWRWLATQGAIWPVIILYLLLVLATLILAFDLRKRHETGLKWDPRSLADLLVLLERSNALTSDSHQGTEVPRLGLWRMSARQGAVFHTYGSAGLPGRRYSLEDGRLREKLPHTSPEKAHRPTTSSSQRDRERFSRDAMLQRSSTLSSTEREPAALLALPWFLRPVFTSLWAIAAIILLLAFLVFTYLPSTALLGSAFLPRLAVPVNRAGFSAPNFLYAFLPTLLAELCLLIWTPLELAHRRLAPFFALLSNVRSASDPESATSHENGDGEKQGATAEHSLLLSYPSLPLPFLPFSALANGSIRLALLGLVTLCAATLPTLAAGLFWSEFFVPTQNVRISTNSPALLALTVFVAVFAFGWLLVLPWTKVERRLSHASSAGEENRALTFEEHVRLVRGSRMLDDVAFHSPLSKTQLVTRLLSAPVGARLSMSESSDSTPSRPATGTGGGAGAGLLSGSGARTGGLGGAERSGSLADSIRGYGGARQRALGGFGLMREVRYRLGFGAGRDGGVHGGVDRVV